MLSPNKYANSREFMTPGTRGGPNASEDK
uniref:Uncharacterized protein n=1 Tax=Arundo donax TaxID=35708 RepID=A0A0A9BKY4_ARUDO